MIFRYAASVSGPHRQKSLNTGTSRSCFSRALRLGPNAIGGPGIKGGIKIDEVHASVTNACHEDLQVVAYMDYIPHRTNCSPIWIYLVLSATCRRIFRHSSLSDPRSRCRARQVTIKKTTKTHGREAFLLLVGSFPMSPGQRLQSKSCDMLTAVQWVGKVFSRFWQRVVYCKPWSVPGVCVQDYALSLVGQAWRSTDYIYAPAECPRLQGP